MDSSKPKVTAAPCAWMQAGDATPAARVMLRAQAALTGHVEQQADCSTGKVGLDWLVPPAPSTHLLKLTFIHEPFCQQPLSSCLAQKIHGLCLAHENPRAL